jgi:hypothetical protein
MKELSSVCQSCQVPLQATAASYVAHSYRRQSSLWQQVLRWALSANIRKLGSAHPT